MKIILLALAVAYYASVAQAATVTFTLDLQKLGAGNFELRAKTSAGDNGGLAFYNVALTNVATVNHNSLRNAAAQNADGSLEGPVGFTLFRTADDTNPTAGPAAIAGSQDTITPTPFLIYGMGQTSGDLASRGIITAGSKEGDPWAADMILAVGTYTPGIYPTFNQEASTPTLANVFNAATGIATSAATIQLQVINTDGSSSLLGMEQGQSAYTPLEPSLQPAVEEMTEPEPRHIKPSTSDTLAFKESLLEYKAALQKSLAQPRLVGGAVAAIPEPSAWMLSAFALLLLRRRAA
jgi:hypothetical protein